MTAQELIDRYNIRLEIGSNGQPTGRALVYNVKLVKADNANAELASRAPEYKAILMQQWQAEQDAIKARAEKIAAIPGLAEIEAASEDLAAWREEFARSFNDVGGLGVRPKPTTDIDGLLKQYPRAAAYLKAESYSLADHYAKAAAGKKALEKIINGDDYAQALAEMDKEWSDYCADHMWD
jgi:hypothetical protein